MLPRVGVVVAVLVMAVVVGAGVGVDLSVVLDPVVVRRPVVLTLVLALVSRVTVLFMGVSLLVLIITVVRTFLRKDLMLTLVPLDLITIMALFPLIPLLGVPI